MLDDELLEEFMHGFFGYGSFVAPFWFIGMEEGGGTSHDEIAARLNAWKQRGKRALEDLPAYHDAFAAMLPEDKRKSITKFFGEEPSLQATWKRIIRVLFAATGIDTNEDNIGAFQRNGLGRQSGNTCVAELLPLPSPSSDRWDFYSEQSSIPYLANRDAYSERLRPERIRYLREKIREGKPKAVIFYGIKYLRWWREIANTKFTREGIFSLHTAVANSILFVVMLHPTPSRGALSDDYFDQVGKAVCAKLKLLEKPAPN
jgi:hypothetical protein